MSYEWIIRSNKPLYDYPPQGQAAEGDIITTGGKHFKWKYNTRDYVYAWVEMSDEEIAAIEPF